MLEQDANRQIEKTFVWMTQRVNEGDKKGVKTRVSKIKKKIYRENGV